MQSKLLTTTIFITCISLLGGTAMADTNSNLEVVKAYLQAMEKMDYDTALQFVDEDVEYINGSSPTVRGKQGILDTLEPFFAPIVENQFIVLRESATDNVVFIERLDRHRIPQGWFELPVTGVFEVKEAKIVMWREYFDLATIRDSMAKLLETE